MCTYQKKLIDYHLVSEKMQEKIADYYKKTKILDKKEPPGSCWKPAVFVQCAKGRKKKRPEASNF